MDKGFRFPESVHVIVTDEHITKGQRADERACPIAHAIQEGGTFPAQDYRAVVLRRHVEIRSAHNDRFLQAYALPERATAFINGFDQWGDGSSSRVKPFDFHLVRSGLTDAEEAAL